MLKDWRWRRDLIGIFEIVRGFDGVSGSRRGKETRLTMVVREEVIAVATGSVTETKHHFLSN